MRVALLSDIHANHIALEAVLNAVRQAHIDRLLICGDLVGYYYSPERVINLLRPWKKHVIRGNHEDMLALAQRDGETLGRIERDYGSGLRVALECMAPDDLAALLALPATESVELDGYRLLLCHGSPWSTDQYVYPDASQALLERCARPGFSAVVMGHTHYPMLREANGVRLINPGSVGQPRDHRPGAAWAILDTSSDEVTFRRESYDVAPLVAEAKARDPGVPYLHQVLLRT